MFFSQNILGLSAVIVGIIATMMRVFDGVTDPPIGILIDRTNTRFGKFRPYMMLGCIIVSASIYAIFHCPNSFSIAGKYLFTTISYAVYVIGYTFQTTCTRAAQSILTKDPKQRPLFAVFNGGFNAILNALFPYILATLMAPKYEGQLQNPQLWADMSIVTIIMMFFCSILACIGLSNIDKPEAYTSFEVKKKIGFKDMLDVIMNNKPLQMLVVAASTDKLALSLMNGLSIYVFSNFILNNALYGQYSSIRALPVLFVSMGGIYLARNFGLKKPFLFSTWMSLICLILMFIIGVNSTHYIVFLVIFTIQACMTGITNNILNPMIADCADYEQYRSGKFIPGIVGTVFTFVDKIISSLSTTVIGFALALAGVSKGQITTNTYISDKFYWIIMSCFCGAPILGHIASIISMKFYDLTKEKMETIQISLKNKIYEKDK